MIDTIFVGKFVIVMFALFITDICWTFYLLDVAAKKARNAAFWSAMIMACGAIAVTNYVTDHRLIIAAMLGAFLGTYFTIKYRVRQDGKKQTPEENYPKNAQSQKVD